MSWEIAWVLGFVGVALILIFISIKTKPEILKTLFIFSSLLILLVLINSNYSIIEIAEATSGANATNWDKLKTSNDTVYQLLMWVIRIVFIYIAVYYTYLLFSYFGNLITKKREKKEKEERGVM